MSRILIGILTLTLATLLAPRLHAAPATTQAGAPPEIIAKGSDALTAGDFKGARDAFQTALTTDPKNIKALHGLGLALFNLGDLPHARENLEKALAAAGATPDRALVLNLSLVHLKQSNAMRGMKLMKEYLSRPSKDLDEPMLNAFGVALNAVDDQAKKNSFYGQSVTLYKSYTAKLEAKRPGMKRWGAEWMSADEVNNKLASSDQNQKKADRLSQQLVGLNRKVDDAKKEVAKKEDLRSKGFIGQWEVREAQQAQRDREQERDRTKANYDAAIAEIQKPDIAPEWEQVALDDLTPPTVGDGNSETVADSSASKDPMARFDTEPHFKGDPKPPAKIAPKPRTGRKQLPPPPQVDKKPTRARMEYAAAFPVASDLLVTASAPLEGATDMQVQAHDGTPIKAELVRSDAKSGLALLRISGPQMAYLDLSPTFAGGTVECAAFPDENLFEPTAEMIKGTAPRAGDGWKIKLEKHPRIPGAPLLAGGKVVGVSVATGDQADIEQLPAATLDQLRRFVGADLPKKAGDNPDALSVMLQVAVNR